MKVITLLTNYFSNMKFRTKLVISYFLLIFIPFGIISFKYYNVTIEVLSELAEKNVYEIIKQDNQIIDTQLFKTQNDSLNMINDKVLFNEIKNAKTYDDYMLLQMDNKLTSVIGSYLEKNSNYYSANILTSYYTFGTKITNIPYKNFNKTSIYKKAVEADGALSWIPTYDFIKMFGPDYINSSNFDYRYMFSAVRMLNCSYVENGFSMNLDESIEKPILIINFKEDLFRKTLGNSIPIKGTYYFVINRDRYIISHSDESKVATYDKSDWIGDIFKKGSGYSIINNNGEKLIACYDTSEVTGWISVVLIPPKELVSSIVPLVKSYTLNLTLIFIIISMFFAYIISGTITKPLKKLLIAIKKTGEGNFDTKVQVSSGGEIGYLIYKFNNMNEKIRLLIEENYLTKIREKETEIMVLNIQLNPHFLYNSLNIINWLAIENKQKEISKLIVSLSSMLQYTAHNNCEMENFEDDLKWLKNYIYIMSCRFDGKFTVCYDIVPELLKQKVPKLFLQPFVENSIMHGFESIESGGIIKISGWVSGDKNFFCTEDNGKGMSNEEIYNPAETCKDNIGIKNVDRRIKLIYGDEYGVVIESEIDKGTKVKVLLPRLD